MKAMILAAGEGTRLRPLTYHTPKIMIPIAGKPLLAYIVGILRYHGINEMAMNLSHLPEIVIDWLGNGDRLGVNVVYSVEDKLLGTAGALTKLRHFFDDTFVVIYGDMLMDLDFRELEIFHRTKGGLATVALFEVEDPRAYGIVEVDEDQRILRFVEKPEPGTTTSRLANAGIYVLEPEVLQHIPDDTFYDFGFDLFPALLEKGARLYGYTTSATILDAGTMENYRSTEKEVVEGRFVPKGV